MEDEQFTQPRVDPRTQSLEPFANIMIRVFQLFDQGTFGDGKCSWLQQFIGRFDFVNQLTVEVWGNEDDLSVSRLEAFWKQLSRVIVAPQIAPTLNVSLKRITLTGKNNRFPFLDILGYLKNTHKNPKFGRVRQVPIRELGWEFPGWDLSHFAKFGIFMAIL